MFEFLFKYRPVLFERGDFSLAAPWPVAAAALVVLMLAAPMLLSYARAGAAGRLERAALAALRLAALAVVLFCLLRPMLVVSTTVPQRNFVGVLLDDSRSMRVADLDGGRLRADFAAEAFAPGAELRDALADRFALRFFRFANAADRVEDPAALRFDGTQTRIARALERARQELAGVPLAGLVVVTDGADNAREPLTETLLALRAAGVPVYTVGLGRPSLERDVELGRVDLPASVLRGASLAVDVVVTHAGYGGRTVPVIVEDEGRIVAEREVELRGDGEPATVRVAFTAEEAGPRRLRVRVPPQPGETVAENNGRDVLLQVVDRREKILYFEGEPRFEVKFIRRAVHDDPNLQVVVLQRVADGKFIRLDVDDPAELRAGFPTTREELFAYRGLILGSVEASFFTHDQLQMIADFVSQRGGGLLALGGRRALGAGGYAGTPVADALPVYLDAEREAGISFAELKVEPTRAGRGHAALRLAADDAASLERWEALPALTSLNPVRRVKPGATALLVGRGDGGERVILAAQRFGRGKAIAFPVQDSWLWQMHADVPLDDPSHETFWRQMLRWLVADVPDPVAATLPRDHVEPGAPVELLADVADSAYLGVNDARVTARVRAPDGTETTIPLDWTVDRDGRYRGTFATTLEGLYEIRVEAERGGRAIGHDVAWLRAAPSDAEYFEAGMREPLLRRIAEETGGRFYTPADVAALPEDITYTGAGTAVVEEHDLWDMPAIFLTLLTLLATEWLWRHRRTLP
ncbi:MAG TPA: hypothetical protein VF212_14990 [Longimicrobiales bacterium]